MLLTEQNICFYLLDQGYLGMRQFVEGEFRVDTLDSRNRNFIVNKDFDNAYFIKHVKEVDAEKTGTLRTEATCYWLAHNDVQFSALREFLPKYHAFDYLNYILVLGYEKNKTSLYDFYVQKGSNFPSIASALGVLLRSYHQNSPQALAPEAAGKFFKRATPWVFSLGNPALFNQTGSGHKAEAQLFKLIREDKAYTSLIAALENQWTCSTLIHNDIKFQNMLINTDHDENTAPSLKIIDWELSDIGDPLWDVAAVFQSYLLLWVSHEMTTKPTQDFSLPVIQPLLREFWNSYMTDTPTSNDEHNARLLKAINYCAMKLIHTSLETTPGAESLSPFGAKLLQLSFNILKSPEQARLSLFGFFN